MAQLLDYLGRPVRSEDLGEELAAVRMGSVRSVWTATAATGLAPEDLARILRSAVDGDADAYLTLAEEMEERDLHYGGVLRTRKLAVEGLEAKVAASSDGAADVKIADAVREITAQDSFGDLLAQLLDALGKGYSVSEIMWDRSEREWTPARFEWRDPRYFCFDIDTRSELRLKDETGPAEGIPLAPFKFAVHMPRIKMGLPVRGGLARFAAASYMCKTYALKDWLALAEIFGLPMRVGKYPAGSSDEQIRKLVSAVVNLGTDAAVVVPEGMLIEFNQAPNVAGAGDFFEKLAAYLDKQVSKGILGQTMTTDEGSSLSQSQTHNEVRLDYVQDDAKKLARTVMRDVIRPFVDLNFGPQKKYPSLSLHLPEQEDLQLLSTALAPFIDRGLRVEESVIRDKFGIPEPAEGEDVKLLSPASGGQGLPGAPAGDFSAARRCPSCGGEHLSLAQQEGGRAVEDALDELAAEELSDWEMIMDPVMDPLRALVGEVNSLDELKKRLPEIAKEMDASRLVERLAVAAFKARGMGDAADDAD